ncbi:Mediator of RNA polymerase II transcription subunit 19a-like protein [Drosera capensis]
MQLDQLTEYQPYSQNGNARIQPLDLDILGEAFHLRETAPLVLPPEEKGTPTIAVKSKGAARDKEAKHKKSKDRDKERDKENKKHKHRHKDRSKDKDKGKDKEKKKDKSRHQDPGAENSKISHEKKRKHDGEEDINEMNQERKSKHKSSKMEAMGTIKSHRYGVPSGLKICQVDGLILSRIVDTGCPLLVMYVPRRHEQAARYDS